MLEKKKSIGYFIAVDGPNGVGKSTLIAAIKNKLEILGYDVYVTREPTDTKLGNFLREFAEQHSGVSLACMVAADRYEHKSMFDTIHHIAIIGSDYEKSKHFYVDLLGFEIIRENYRKERDDYKIDLACGEQEIELFIIKDAPARVNYPEALGLRHLAFKVKSVDDTVKELNAKGIATEPVRLDDYTGKKMTFFHDPDNLPLEIHE